MQVIWLRRPRRHQRSSASRKLALAGALVLALSVLVTLLQPSGSAPPTDQLAVSPSEYQLPSSIPAEPESAPPRPAAAPALGGRSPEGLSLHVLRYLPLIVEIGGEIGVDPAVLAAIMEVEGSGEGEVSSAGAMGLMQVMPDKLAPGDDPFDPSTNIRRAAQHVRYLTGVWSDDLAAVAGAYFGAIDSQGFVTEASDGIVDGVEYVGRFAIAYGRWAAELRKPARAVVIRRPAPRLPIAPYTVQPGDSVQALAARYGVSVATLVAANDLTDPDLVLVGQELLIPSIDGLVHRFAAGEDLFQLAERYGVPIDAVVQANELKGEPRPGALLLMPGAVPNVTPVPAAPAPAPPRRLDSGPPPSVTARYVAILDEASGDLLHGQDERVRVAPASLTKIATTLVALEREPDLDKRIGITISGSAMAARDGSSIMGLEPGREMALRTLLYGMMLPSGNDAAEQIALALAGSRDGYVDWMNEAVTSLGLEDTRFVNPSGMDAPDQYSTAYDMAQLGRIAMRNETFRQLAGAATYVGDGYNLSNLNRLIGSYLGADGIKIGRTRLAGRTIVASAARDGHRVYISLLRSQDTAADSKVLFDWVWRTFTW
jgi:D-alanyl-D-alanine carboxypeptidase/LysM repeat protein